MENQTFRSRLSRLMQRSRKALHLYTTMGRIHGDQQTDFSEMQIREWKGVNAELIKQIGSALENANNRRLVSDTFVLRDRFYSEWRMAESELHTRQKELIAAAENADYAKAALLSRDLVSLKARVQACQAAHHELNEVIRKSHAMQPTVELSTADVIEEDLEIDREVEQPAPVAKVIPLSAGMRQRAQR